MMRPLIQKELQIYTDLIFPQFLPNNKIVLLNIAMSDVCSIGMCSNAPNTLDFLFKLY